MAHMQTNTTAHEAEIFVDKDGLALLNSRRWWVVSRVTPSGRTYLYLETKIDGKTALFHRVLLGTAAGYVVDHINGNGLDNRACNLRECSHAENMRNRRINVGHAHGFKGVGLHSKYGTFYAQIRAGKIRRFKGGFRTAQEAADAYAAMAIELHGEFARTD